MKFFKKLFTKKQASAHDDKHHANNNKHEEETVTSNSTRATYSIAKKESVSKLIVVKAPANGPTANEQIAERWITCLNEQRSQEEMLGMFVTPEAGFVFEDGFFLPAKYLVPNMHYVYTCFPDFKLSNQGYKEVKPGVVLIEEQILTGTHTGEPFKFDKFPPVPTTNKAIALDPERAYVHFNDDGKITKIEMLAMGDLVGLHGMYLAIGGKLEVPAESTTEEEAASEESPKAEEKEEEDEEENPNTKENDSDIPPTEEATPAAE